MSQEGDDWLRGERVAITGRFASLAHEEVRAVVEQFGGRYQHTPSGQTRYLVVGAGGLPLEDDARPTRALQVARTLMESGFPLEVLPEEVFWHRLGIAQDEVVQRHCTVAQLSRLLAVDRDRIRRWVRAGLIEPAVVVHRLPLFDFSQVQTAKTLCDLVERGVPLRRVRRNLERLERWLPSAARSLGQLACIEQSGQVHGRDAQNRLLDADGQQRFDFDAPALDEGLSDPDCCLSVDARRSADDWFAIALSCEEEGRYEAARQAYAAAAELEPGDAVVQFNLGNVCAHLNQPESAVAAYDRALQLEPDYAEAWNNLGIALGTLRQLEQAAAALRQAVELVPDYSDALCNLADTLAELGDGDAAECFRRRDRALNRRRQFVAIGGRCGDPTIPTLDPR